MSPREAGFVRSRREGDAARAKKKEQPDRNVGAVMYILMSGCRRVDVARLQDMRSSSGEGGWLEIWVALVATIGVTLNHIAAWSVRTRGHSLSWLSRKPEQRSLRSDGGGRRRRLAC